MPIVTTTGRKMTTSLQRALDDVPASQREFLIQALGETETAHPCLNEIFLALAVELRLCALREEDTMTSFAVQMAEAPDWLPEPPAITGKSVNFDPDTQTFTDAEDE